MQDKLKKVRPCSGEGRGGKSEARLGISDWDLPTLPRSLTIACPPTHCLSLQEFPDHAPPPPQSISLLLQEFPDHGIFGEEFGVDVGQGLYTWVLDPIDGTKSFITGKGGRRGEVELEGRGGEGIVHSRGCLTPSTGQ